MAMHEKLLYALCDRYVRMYALGEDAPTVVQRILPLVVDATTDADVESGVKAALANAVVSEVLTVEPVVETLVAVAVAVAVAEPVTAVLGDELTPTSQAKPKRTKKAKAG